MRGGLTFNCPSLSLEIRATFSQDGAAAECGCRDDSRDASEKRAAELHRTDSVDERSVQR